MKGKLKVYKQIISLVLCLAMVLSCVPTVPITVFSAQKDVWDGTVASSPWDSGSGVENDPYIIYTVAQLAKLSENVNNGTTYSGVYFKLGTDLDLNGSAYNWTPIGTDSRNYFAGTLDGGGYTISNLKIESSQQYVGLFGYVNGGTVKNVILEAPHVTTSSSNAKTSIGALIGYHAGSGTMEFCAARNGSVSAPNSTCASTYSGLGGLVGCNAVGSYSIFYCYSYNTNVSTKDNTMTRCGGVVGSNNKQATACYTYNPSQKGIPVVGGYSSGSGTPARYCAYLGDAYANTGSTLSGQGSFSEEQFSDGTVAFFLRTAGYSNLDYPWGQDVESDTKDPLPVWNGAKVYKMQYTSLVDDTPTLINVYLNDLEIKQIDGKEYRVIRDAYDWAFFANQVNINDGNKYLNTNWNAIVEPAGAVIDFSVFGTIAYKNGYHFRMVMIGAVNSSKAYYGGTFNGNGCTVSGLSVNNAPLSYMYGLFGQTSATAHISGITVKNATVTTQRSGSAVLVVENRGTLENCHVVDSGVTVTDGFAGGITYSNAGTVKNCSFSGSVTSGRNAGGIAAAASDGAQFINCWNTGTISGKTTSASSGNYAGGILAQEKNGVTIDNCYNAGNITGYYAGGIAGSRYGYTTVKDCHNYGTVTGTNSTPIAKGSLVSNSYYLADSETDNVSGTTYKTAAQFKDGTVLQLLNAGNTEPVWFAYTDYPILENKHQHVFTYALSGTDTIVATCNAQGCDLIDGHGGSVTIVASDVGYDGTSKGAQLNYTDWQLGESAKPVIAYSGTTGTGEIYGPTTNTPKDAGSYTAAIIMGEEGAAVTATVPYQITPATVTENMITIEPASVEYTGEVVAPVVTVKNEGIILEENTDYTLSGGIRETNVGEYTIIVSGKGNYTGTVSTSWIITPKTMTGISAENIQTTYDGNSYSITVNGAPAGATITYSTDGENYTQTNPTFKNVADSGTVYYKVSMENYSDFLGSATVTIDKATLTVTQKETELNWYPKMGESKTAVKSYFSVTYPNGDSYSFQVAEMFDSLGNPVTKIENAGTYTIKVAPYFISANYVFSNDTFTITVNPLDLSKISADDYISVTAKEPTYTGQTVFPQMTESGKLAIHLYIHNVKTGKDALYALAQSDGYWNFEVINVKNNTDAGDAYVNITGNGSNVVGSYEYKYTIKQKEMEAPTGLGAIDETISQKKDGKIIGLTTEMEYSTSKYGTYTKISDTNMLFEPGTYYVRVAATNDNYKSSEAVELTIAEGRALAVTIPEKTDQVGYTLTASKSTLKWHGSTVLTFALAEGYSKTDGFAVKVNGENISLDAYGKYTVTNAKRDIAVTVEGVADLTPPETIVTVKEIQWKQFVNKITFGLFFKDSIQVKVNATDLGSGISTIEYLLTDIAFEDEKTVNMDESAWVSLTLENDSATFDIDANTKKYVYVRVKDNAGNCAVVSSDGGVVVYTDAQADTTEVDFVKTTAGDVAVKVKLNGNTIKAVAKDGSILVKDIDYTIDNETGTIVLKASYLNMLAARDEGYSFTVSYNPMDVVTDTVEIATTFVVNVKKAEPVVTAPIAKTATYNGQKQALLTAGTVEGGIMKYSADGTEWSENIPVGMNADTYTVYYKVEGDENHKDVEATPVTVVVKQREVTVVVTDQTITYGETILEEGFHGNNLVKGHTLNGSLIPSTQNVTANGTILVEVKDITANGISVKNNYNIVVTSGKLVIEPDLSKLEGVDNDNVTGRYKTDMEAVKKMMDEAEYDLADDTTKKEWIAITKKCQELLKIIADVEAEVARIEKEGAKFDADTVNSSHKEGIVQLLKEIDQLLAKNNLTEEERTALEEVKQEGLDLLKVIEEAAKATKTENTDKVKDITPETVTPEDKSDLKAAKEDLEKALEKNDGNYTDDEKRAIVDDIKRIEDAVKVLENVEDVKEQIGDLPETITKEDEAAVGEAKKSYEELSDYEKSLIEPETKEKLDEAVKTIEEMNTPVFKTYLMGDSNLDGEVTALDAMLVLKHVVKLNTLERIPTILGDMNENGDVENEDGLEILGIVVKLAETREVEIQVYPE